MGAYSCLAAALSDGEQAAPRLRLVKPGCACAWPTLARRRAAAASQSAIALTVLSVINV